MRKLIQRIRVWLIIKLVGNLPIAMNMSFYGEIQTMYSSSPITSVLINLNVIAKGNPKAGISAGSNSRITGCVVSGFEKGFQLDN